MITYLYSIVSPWQSSKITKPYTFWLRATSKDFYLNSGSVAPKTEEKIYYWFYL